MKTPKHPRNIFSSTSQATAASALNLGKKVLAFSLAYLMIPLGMGDLYAQSATALHRPISSRTRAPPQQA